MRVLGTIFSAIFALIAIPLFTIAACNFAIEAAVFNRTTYDAVLEDDAIFEGLLTVALPLVLENAEIDINLRENVPVSVRITDVSMALEEKPAVWAQVTNLLIPPDWLQTTTIQLVDIIFSVIDGDIDAVEQEIDLAELRVRFSGDEANQAANLIIREAPICSEAQLEDLQGVLSSQGGVLPICNPDDDRLERQAIAAVQAWFELVAQDFGTADTVPVESMLAITKDGARRFSIFVDLIFNQALILLYLCPMALLSLVVMLVVRSLGGFGRWIGSVAIAVGVFILILIFALQVVAFGSISDAVANNITPAEIFLSRLFSAMARSAIGESSSSLLFQSGVFIAFGFILFALAWYFGRQEEGEGSVVFITDDGDIISTATKQRVGSITEKFEDDQPPT